MGHLLRDQCLGDDADDVPAFLQHGVGKNAHQPAIGPAVDEADAARGQRMSEFARGLGVLLAESRARTGEGADARHWATRVVGPGLCQGLG